MNRYKSITGTVKVSSPRDTAVIFIDVKTGVNYAIPYITSGASETIRLEKGKWYSVETGEGLTMSLVGCLYKKDRAVDIGMSLPLMKKRKKNWTKRIFHPKNN